MSAASWSPPRDLKSLLGRHRDKHVDSDQQSVTSNGGAYAALEFYRMINSRKMGFEMKPLQGKSILTILEFQRDDSKERSFWKGQLIVTETSNGTTTTSTPKSISIKPIQNRVFALTHHLAGGRDQHCFFIKAMNSQRPTVWTLSGSVQESRSLFSVKDRWNSWGILAGTLGISGDVEFDTFNHQVQVKCHLYGGITLPLSVPFDVVAQREFETEYDEENPEIDASVV